MKKLFTLLITFFIVLYCTSCKNFWTEKRSKTLLEQTNESELKELYKEMIDYVSQHENYELSEKTNTYFLKDESIKYILISLYNFHKENHLPILQGVENRKNEKSWFYFYDLILHNTEVTDEKLKKWEQLITECDYCRLSYKNDMDITWPKVSLDLINDFPKIKETAIYTIKRLNDEKRRADEEEAWLKNAERFKGFWIYKFGMSYNETKAIINQLSKDDFIISDLKAAHVYFLSELEQPIDCKSASVIIAASKYIVDFEGKNVVETELYYTNDGKLYSIKIRLDTLYSSYRKDELFYFANEVSKKYGLKYNGKARGNKVYKSNYGIELTVSEGIMPYFQFTDTNILNTTTQKRDASQESQ